VTFQKKKSARNEEREQILKKAKALSGKEAEQTLQVAGQRENPGRKDADQQGIPQK